jgi:hypothetical protein
MQVSLEACSGAKDARFFILCPAHLQQAAAQFANLTSFMYQACGLGQLLPFPASQIHPAGAVIPISCKQPHVTPVARQQPEASVTFEARPAVPRKSSMPPPRSSVKQHMAPTRDTDGPKVLVQCTANGAAGVLAANKGSEERAGLHKVYVPFALPTESQMPCYVVPRGAQGQDHCGPAATFPAEMPPHAATCASAPDDELSDGAALAMPFTTTAQQSQQIQGAASPDSDMRLPRHRCADSAHRCDALRWGPVYMCRCSKCEHSCLAALL